MKNYLRYLYAILAVPLAILLRFALMPLLGPGVPYITIYAVTATVAVLGGLGPAVVTAFLGAILTDYFFIPPLHIFDLSVTFDSQVAVVVGTSAFVGYVSDSLRKSRAKVEKQAAELLESQADLSRAQEVSRMGNWRMNVQRNELIWSKENHRIFGIPAGTAMTFETFLAAVHLDDRQYVDEKWTAALRGEPYDIEHRIVVDGKVRWVHEKAELEVDSNGVLLGGFGTTQDITELKESKAAVSVSELRYRRLFEAARDGILILDADSGQIVDVNPFIKNILGYSHEELMGRKLWEIGPFRNIAASKEAFQELQNKGYVRHENLPLETKDGRHISVEFISNVYLVDQRKVIQCNIRDITDRVKAEKAAHQARDDLARSNRDLEQFAYVASHDLQEPLRAVAGFVELLRRNLHDSLDAKTTIYMDFAVDGAKRMQSLVNGLLEYSRIGQGERHEETSARTALDRAMAQLLTAMEESQAEVTADELPKVHFDAIQLVQVFQNLIGNAIKFRGEDAPRIHIGAARDGDGWRFSVSDNGIGIEPGYAERIFLIFQRLHDREKYPGTGIGLAICKRIVEHHNGKIWVESKPGIGSTFCFTIPNKGAN